MYRGPAANRWLTPSARRPEAITTFVDHAVAWLGPADDGHDLLGDLDHPASLGPGLTPQTLKGLPLTHTLLGDQRPLGLLDHHPGIQRPLELGGQVPPLLT